MIERMHATWADPADCVVVGGGPAGLTAAIYLTRFHLSVLVVDSGDGRAASIPLTRNHAGFPDGISGVDLLDRMRAQACRFGVDIIPNEVMSLKFDPSGFAVWTADRVICARTVLLATGVVDRRPAMDGALHDEALARGLLRYCAVCDGYEVSDRPLAVLGTGRHGTDEALFVRSFTQDVTLIAPEGVHDLTEHQRARLKDGGIRLVDGPYGDISLGEDHIELMLPGGPWRFAALYPALGSDVRSQLAARLGASLSDGGCMIVDAHQRTDVPGLYAAGDVVLGLDQISHAMGGGGVAAMTIRNDLDKERPLRR